MTVTLDKILAGFQAPLALDKPASVSTAMGNARWWSEFLVPGLPGTGVASSAGMSGETLTGPLAGCFVLPSPTAPALQYLAAIGECGFGGYTERRIVDRLWQNSGIDVTSTAAQTVNSVAFPARDLNGSSNGAGVCLALEVTTATGNGSNVTGTTASYTNSDGTSGRTATLSLPIFASSKVSFWIDCALQGADQGVRSVQSITLGGSLTSGALSMVAYREIFAGANPSSVYWNLNADFIYTRLERIYSGACLHVLTMASSTAINPRSGLVFVTHLDPD